MFICGSGLILMGCVRLRVKDLDFAQRQISCATAKDRKTASPSSLQPLSPPNNTCNRSDRSTNRT
jgi:hypothetical protein